MSFCPWTGRSCSQLSPQHLPIIILIFICLWQIILICDPPSFFLPGLPRVQVSAATNVPNRLEISEWRERQEETGPPRPLLSPSSSVQWTDRHCRWLPPLLPPPAPPAPGAPAPALLWDNSDSAEEHREEKVNWDCRKHEKKNNFKQLAFSDPDEPFKIHTFN